MKPEEEKMSQLIYKCLKNPELLKEFKQNPKKVIERELKIKLPESYKLEVLEDTLEKGYVVLPQAQTINELSDEELKALAGGTGVFTPSTFLTPKLG